MQEKAVKGGFAGVGAILTYLNGSFTSLVYVMVAFEIMDYITGMLSARQNGGWSKKDAIQGAIKKFCYFFLVAVAFLFDYMIVETTGMVGFDFNWPSIFGILSVCYLISTEGISILENLAEIGIAIPFLTFALKLFKEKINKKGEE